MSRLRASGPAALRGFVAAAVGTTVLVAVTITLAVSHPGSARTGRTHVAAARSASPALVSPARRGGPLPAGHRVSCPAPTVTVSTAAGLTAALRAAKPGTSIRLADGTYRGTFEATTSGTSARPVWLCGRRAAVLDVGTTGKGYGLHLDPAEHWRVVGLTVRNAQKGVVADGTRGTVLQGLLVEQIGDEGIHLRSASSGNTVLGNTVRRTGLRKPKFGEGIYVGSANSNWGEYSAGGPDRSDRNLVQENTISDTSAESVDIKEGTTGGLLTGNVFDGTGLTGADSWVDVKGNDWIVADNVGRSAGKDGFQTHQVYEGWGTGNVFRGNTATDRGSGVDFYIHKPDDTGNRVVCDNRGGSGGAATSNVVCTPASP